MKTSEGGAAAGGPEFTPYIGDETTLRELTPRALVLGTLLGVVFGASSLYLVLKVGLTVSASIPVAVISITLFRLASQARRSRRDDPREQHRPDRGLRGRVDRVRRRRDDAGDHDPRVRPRDHARDARRGARRPARHPDDDPAAARAHRRAARASQVPRGHRLRRGAQGGRVGGVARGGLAGGARRGGAPRRQPALSATTIFTGFGIGLALQDRDGRAARAGRTCRRRCSARRSRRARSRPRSRPSCSASATSSGRGSPRSMCAGGVLAYLVLIPLIKFFGDAIPGALAPGTIPISEMGPAPDPQRLRALHRRRRGRGGRHHQPVPLAADHLARPARGAARRERGARRGPAAPHRARPLDAARARRHRRARRRDLARAAAPHEPARRGADRRARLPLRHGLVAPHRRDRLVVEPDLRDDGRDAAPHLPRLPRRRLDRAGPTT